MDISDSSSDSDSESDSDSDTESDDSDDEEDDDDGEEKEHADLVFAIKKISKSKLQALTDKAGLRGLA